MVRHASSPVGKSRCECLDVFLSSCSRPPFLIPEGGYDTATLCDVLPWLIPVTHMDAAGGYDRTLRIFKRDQGHSREVYHTKRMQRQVCAQASLFVVWNQSIRLTKFGWTLPRWRPCKTSDGIKEDHTFKKIR